MIDWINFTPWTGLAGGILIGTGAAILLLFNGRIAGISGIMGGLLKNTFSQQLNQDSHWRMAFFAGLVAAPIVWQSFSALPAIVIEADYITLAIAGFVVGISTRYGAGCTSGHGVCGISRLSVRSIIATILFMLSGGLTVYVIRHLISQ
jgi:uncharacterized protein